MISTTTGRYSHRFLKFQSLFKACIWATVLVFSGIISYHPVAAQVDFGVVWEPSGNESTLNNQLAALQELGFTHLYIPAENNPDQMALLDNYSFDIHIEPTYRYLLSQTVQQNRTSITDSLLNRVLFYSSYEQVSSIGLFGHSQTYDTLFTKTVIPIVDLLSRQTSKKLVTITTAASFKNKGDAFITDYYHLKLHQFSVGDSLSLPENITGIIYEPASNRIYRPAAFRHLLQTLARTDTPSVLFITSEWLTLRLAEGQPISDIIAIFKTSEDATFAINNTDTNTSGNHISTILLLILFGSLAFHYYNTPAYRKSLFRYFNTHAFFVNDIMAWRIRATLPGVILMIQHALAGGILMYVIFSNLLSITGWQALIHHYPVFYYIHSSLPFMALYGAAFIFAVELFFVLWLYLTNRSVKHLNQIILLYAWPMHLGIIISGLVVILVQYNFSATTLLITAGFYIFFWLIGTLVAVVDLSTGMRQKSNQYIIINFVFLSVLSAGIAIMLYKLNVPAVFDLALALS